MFCLSYCNTVWSIIQSVAWWFCFTGPIGIFHRPITWNRRELHPSFSCLIGKTDGNDGKMTDCHIILSLVIEVPSCMSQVKYCSIPSWLISGLSTILMVPTTRNPTVPPTSLQSWWNHRLYIVGTNPKHNTNQWLQTANLNRHIYTWNRETSKAIT